MPEFKRLTQKMYEAFFALLDERGVIADRMTRAQYAGDVVRCAVDVGWVEMNVDEADPREVLLTHRAISRKIEEILAPSPN